MGYGYKTWKNKFKRQVIKGQKGIRIYVPIETKEEKEFEKIDRDTQKPVRDSDGKIVTEILENYSLRFKLVPVFDVSQTFGEPMPSIAENLIGDVENMDDLVEALKIVSPLPIFFESLPEEVDGQCIMGQKIEVRTNMSDVQTVAAILHEIAHAKLHDTSNQIEDLAEKTISKNIKEVEAESIAYTVCQYFGIETSQNSFGYIAEWSKGKELTELKSSLDTIRKTATGLITSIEKELEEILKNQNIKIETAKEQQEQNIELSSNKYKYYSLRRPVDIGTYPKENDNVPIEIVNFDSRIFVENEAFQAWGYLVYNQVLTEQQIYDYELRAAYTNPINLDKNEQAPSKEKSMGDIFKEYTYLIAELLPKDTVYKEACQNGALGILSNEEVKKECQIAVERIVKSEFTDIVEYKDFHGLYKKSMDFTKRLIERVFDKTFTQPYIDNYQNPFLKNIYPEKPSNQKPKAKENTRPHIIYHKFAKLFPQIESQEYRYMRLGAGKALMPLSLEWIEKSKLSIMHTYVQNGDLMYDPEMTLIIDTVNHTINAETYTLSGLGLYQNVYSNDFLNENLQKELNSFVLGWLDNIEYQHYEPVRGIKEIDGEDIEIIFDEKGVPIEGVFTEDESVPINEQIQEKNNDEDIQTTDTQQDTQKAEPSLIMPDPNTTIQDMRNYGYHSYDGMLPLSQDKALELFDLGFTVYEIIANEDTESMIFERNEIIEHGLFGVEREEWENSEEYCIIKESLAAEKTDIEISEFSIYQLKDGEELHYHRFTSYNTLKNEELNIKKENYNLVYTAPLENGITDTTLTNIFRDFNVNLPTDFTGHSLSVSDVIVLNNNGKISSYYVDSADFKELPVFIGNETFPTKTQIGINFDSPSVYDGMTAIHANDDLVYLGKTENVIFSEFSPSYYDNSDKTLIFISENKNIFALLEDGGWSKSQEHLLKNNVFALSDFKEFDCIQGKLSENFLTKDKFKGILFAKEPYRKAENIFTSSDKNKNQSLEKQKPSILAQLNTIKKSTEEKSQEKNIKKIDGSVL